MVSPDPKRSRRWAVLLLLSVAVVGLAWGLVVVARGPIRFNVAGLHVTTEGPLRPLVLAALAFGCAATLRGWGRVWRDAVRLSHACTILPGRAWAQVCRVDDRIVVLVIAIATGVVGVSQATTAASGSDSYGYVSQADLWIAGELTIDQSWASAVPWPSARWTFTPLGYRPSPLASEAWRVTPIYSPGLPMVLAVAKIVGGQAAMFWVVPVSGALLVLATFGIGRRLGSSKAGVIGALLVATSPAMLFMLMSPMTDVPVAAAWAIAFYFLLDDRLRSAWFAGIAVGLAVLIRPNLVMFAGVLGLWYVIRLWKARGADRRVPLVQGACFSVGVMAGVLGTALFNYSVYGSPFTSGYGTLDGMFMADHFWPNARQYSRWLIESQTPVVLAGVAALLLPVRWIWPGTRHRSAFLVIGMFVGGLWVTYCFYLVFTEWWYLRFLLSSWPFLMLGCGAVIVAVTRRGGGLVTFLATAAVITLAVTQIIEVTDRNIFGLWKEERRYVGAAQLVRSMTDRQSVIFSMQHSGSIRYYGGRMSMRYDMLERRWVDRAIDWLTSQGVRPYLLIDQWEMAEVEKAFAGQRALERLREPPMLRYLGNSRVLLFDLGPLPPPGEREPPRVEFDRSEDLRSVPPVALYPPKFGLGATAPASRADGQ